MKNNYNMTKFVWRVFHNNNTWLSNLVTVHQTGNCWLCRYFDVDLFLIKKTNL